MDGYTKPYLDQFAVVFGPGNRRCLAPGVPEHSFWSTDRKRNRYCLACLARMLAQAKEPFKVRFFVEAWNRPAPPGDWVRPGRDDVQTDQCGYTDRLITISIVGEGTPFEEVSIVDSEGGDGHEQLRQLVKRLEANPPV